MSLINCKVCGKEISDKAIMCPHCGEPVATSYNAKDDNNSVNLHQAKGVNVRLSDRKILIIIVSSVLAVVIITSAIILSINRDNLYSDSDDSASSSVSSSYKYGAEISDSTLEYLVESALYSEVSSKYGSSGADPSSCNYSINKASKGGAMNTIVVYGTVSLYDKYGKLLSFKKSSAIKDFEVTIDKSTWKVKSTKID